MASATVWGSLLGEETKMNVLSVLRCSYYPSERQLNQSNYHLLDLMAHVSLGEPEVGPGDDIYPTPSTVTAVWNVFFISRIQDDGILISQSCTSYASRMSCNFQWSKYFKVAFLYSSSRYIVIWLCCLLYKTPSFGSHSTAGPDASARGGGLPSSG